MAPSKQSEPLRQNFSIPRAFAATDPERQREVIGFGRRASFESAASFDLARDGSRPTILARQPRASGSTKG